MLVYLKNIIRAAFVVFVIAMLTAYLIAANSPYHVAPDSFWMCMIKNDSITKCLGFGETSTEPDKDSVPAKVKSPWKKDIRFASAPGADSVAYRG